MKGNRAAVLEVQRVSDKNKLLFTDTFSVPVFTGEIFVSGPTQERVGSSGFICFISHYTNLFPFGKETIGAREKMVLSWSNWHVEKEIFKRSLFSLICSTLKKF
jgi:hypothetical protein